MFFAKDPAEPHEARAVGSIFGFLGTLLYLGGLVVVIAVIVNVVVWIGELT